MVRCTAKVSSLNFIDLNESVDSWNSIVSSKSKACKCDHNCFSFELHWCGWTGQVHQTDFVWFSANHVLQYIRMANSLVQYYKIISRPKYLIGTEFPSANCTPAHECHTTQYQFKQIFAGELFGFCINGFINMVFWLDRKSCIAICAVSPLKRISLACFPFSTLWPFPSLSNAPILWIINSDSSS